MGNGKESEYNGAVVMTTAHILGLNASGQGYIVENNTSSVVEGHAWVSVTVPDNTDAVISRKAHLSIAQLFYRATALKLVLFYVVIWLPRRRVMGLAYQLRIT